MPANARNPETYPSRNLGWLPRPSGQYDNTGPDRVVANDRHPSTALRWLPTWSMKASWRCQGNWVHLEWQPVSQPRLRDFPLAQNREHPVLLAAAAETILLSPSLINRSFRLGSLLWRSKCYCELSARSLTPS